MNAQKRSTPRSIDDLLQALLSFANATARVLDAQLFGGNERVFASVDRLDLLMHFAYATILRVMHLRCRHSPFDGRIWA